MTGTPHIQELGVRVADVGAGRLATLPAVAGWLQEAAWMHALALGFSNRAMGEAGVAWVLARMAVRMRTWPELGQRVRVATWPSGLERLRATRDFRVLDEDGGEMGAATSVWVALDVVRRRAVPIPQFVADGYPPLAERALELETRHLPEPGEGAATATVMTRAADLDENGHVNNVHLLEWAMEPLAAGAAAPGDPLRPALADIAFRVECRHPETVTARCAALPDAPGLAHALERADGTQILRMRTAWDAARAGGEL